MVSRQKEARREAETVAAATEACGAPRVEKDSAWQKQKQKQKW